MYHAHFDLARSPFSIAPDPHFLYMSERHREALAHLMWGLDSDGGFVLLTGEVGTGKTTLSRCLLEKIPEDTDLAFVINPKVTVTELLATVCEELGVPVSAEEATSVKRLVDRINHRLLDAHARGRRTVLVIDEAQNLAIDVLEQIRLLTNLETSERKLLQVILIGQPELADMLRRPELRQLAQRITARYHLEPLSCDELGALVQHRMNVAGARRNPFTDAALRTLHARARGIPRLANVIADRALLGTYAEGGERVTPRIVKQAAREVLGNDAGVRRRPLLLGGAAAGVAVLALLAVLLLQRDAEPGRQAAPAAVATPTTEPAAPAAPATTAEAAPAPTPVPGAGSASAARAPEPATATPDEAPPALPSDLTALWNLDPEASRRAAVQAVLAAWRTPLTLAADSDPCAQVTAVGLRCLAHEGNWPSLVVLDRPAVLELWKPGAPAPRYAALLANDDDRITLGSGAGAESRISVTRSLLDRLWRGRATVLWQMPPGYGGPTRRGDDDATVAWLQSRLDLIDGRTPQMVFTAPFDAALQARLRAFQLREGVRADGVAGPHTWILINGHTAAGVPSLRAGGTP